MAASAAAPRDITTAGVGLVVLTRDEALVHTLQAVSTEYQVFPVSAESDLAAHLVTSTTGVAILDVSAVASSVDRLSEKLKAQFPDLVLIVAGSVDDQSTLATQITRGTIYRFLHKPVSEQRVKLFVDAAWRRHSEGLSGGAPGSATGASREQPAAGRNLLALGAAIAAAAVLGGFFLNHRTNTPVADVTPVAAVAVAAHDALLEDDLARAQAAFAQRKLVAPPGASAVDWYTQALNRNPNDPRAARGIDKVIDTLLSDAEAQLLAQHLDEAQRLTDLARAIKPNHVRVAFLQAQIGKERERAVLSRARQAAADGNIEQALAVLDGANHGTQPSNLVNEARQELEQKQLDTRIRDFISRANDRMRDGQLVEPAQDNARFYIESAQALAPNDAAVKQTQQLLLERLVSEARKAIASGNVDQAQHWIAAADEAGVSPDIVAQLTQGAQRARATVETDALAHQALLAQAAAQATARAAAAATQLETEAVPAAALTIVKYTPPEFPRQASEKALTGWVDVQFLVLSDGSVSDVSVVGADPVGVFETPAMDAVRKWKYQPVMRDGKPINQRARVRVRFALQK
jgi:TonB family protein